MSNNIIGYYYYITNSDYTYLTNVHLFLPNLILQYYNYYCLIFIDSNRNKMLAKKLFPLKPLNH